MPDALPDDVLDATKEVDSIAENQDE